MDDILEFLKEHPRAPGGKVRDASERLFGDTEMRQAATDPPTAWQQLAALQQERAAVERNLPPEKQKQLDDCRIAMSCATTADERAKIKQQINAIDPAFARIAAGICESQVLAQVEPFDAGPSPVQQRNPQFVRLSTIACHQPRQSDRGFEGRALDSFLRRERQSAISALGQQSDDWYAPFSQEFRAAKNNMLQVDCGRHDGKLTARLYIPNGSDRQYLQTDHDRPIAVQIDKLVEQKLQELEKRFNVSFSRVNQPVMKPLYNDGSGKYLEGNTELLGRQPTLNELVGVEAALELSRCTLDGPKVKINFLSNPTVDGEPHAGEYWGEIKGSPTIMMFSQKIPPELKLTDDMHRSWQAAMKETLLHEIAHHNQRKFNFDANKGLIESMGWVQIPGDKGWLLRGKQPGEFYRFDRKARTWSACTDRGEVMPAPAFSSCQIRDKALVRPVSDYFDTPAEMYAEAMAHFRAGGFRRALLTKNPELYEVIKRSDQLDIDEHQKRDGGSDGGAIRLPSGRVVARTAGNLQTVKDFETLFSSAPVLPERASEAVRALGSARQLATEEGIASPELDTQLAELSERIVAMTPELDKFREQTRAIDRHAGPASPACDDSELIAYESGAADLKAESYTLIGAHLLAAGNLDEARQFLALAAAAGKVQTLPLKGSGFGDQQLAEFGKLHGVTSLSLDDLPITSKSIDILRGFKTLTTLSLSNNHHLDEAFFNRLQEIPALTDLSMTLPGELSAESLTALSSLRHLKTLTITAANQTEAAGLESLRHRMPGCVISININAQH